MPAPTAPASDGYQLGAAAAAIDQAMSWPCNPGAATSPDFQAGYAAAWTAA